MVQRKQQKQPRISDASQINYVKGILQVAQNKCLEQQLHSPDMYIAMAQQLADSYSAADARYPKVSFNREDLNIKGHSNPIPELTATIGNQTSTSYFLVKDSLPKGQKATQEELTIFRPDIVSQQLAAKLGIAQPPQSQANNSIPPIPDLNPGTVGTGAAAIPPIPDFNGGVTASNPAMSKAAAAAGIVGNEAATIPNPVEVTNTAQVQTQTQTQAPTAPAPNLAGFANLANGATQTAPTQAAPVSPEPTSTVEDPYAEQNPYANAAPTQAAPTEPTQAAPTQTAPVHNPDLAKTAATTNKVLKTTGKAKMAIGQLLKDMGKGEMNPLQLYGDTFQMIGSFLQGIPEGVNKARAEQLAKRFQEAEQQRAALKLRMNQMGESFLAEDKDDSTPPNNSQPNQTNQTNQASQTNQTSQTAPAQPETVSQTVEPPKDPTQQPIEKLLKSNLSTEQKLDAIEKTLDKILEELKAIEQRLDAIALAQQLESTQSETEPTQSAPTETTPVETTPEPVEEEIVIGQEAAPAPGMVLESEASTEIEQLVNPEADVPVTTVIDTDIVTEAKTVAEAQEEVEVPEVELDMIPDEEGELDPSVYIVESILSYDGDLGILNETLQGQSLTVHRSEVGDSFSIAEINDGVPSIIFSAEMDGESFTVSTDLNQQGQEQLLEHLLEAQETILDLEEAQEKGVTQTEPEPPKAKEKEQFCIEA